MQIFPLSIEHVVGSCLLGIGFLAGHFSQPVPLAILYSADLPIVPEIRPVVSGTGSLLSTRRRLSETAIPGGTALDPPPTSLGEALASADPIKANTAFSSMLGRLTRENAGTYWEVLRQGGVHSQRGPRIALFLETWGYLDGQAALEALSGMPEQLKAMALSGYVSDDSEEAMSWLQQQDDSEILTQGLVRGMARVDIELATMYLESMLETENPERFISELASRQLSEGFDSATSWAQEIHDETLKGEAFAQVAKNVSIQDLDAAGTWIMRHANVDHLKTAAAEIASRLTERALARQERALGSTIHWLEQLPEGAVKNGAYFSTFRAWAGHAPNAAGEFLGQLSDSDTKDAATVAYSSRIAAIDPQSAAAWAATIQDTELQERALMDVATRSLGIAPQPY